MTTMTPIPDPSHPVTGPRRRRRHLAVLLVLAGLVAAAPGVATLAGFTAQDVNRDNTISAGVLDVAFGQATSAFNVANMKPGDWFDTSVPILNTGSMTEDYSFSATSLRPGGPANLDEVLRVTVSRQGTVLAENLRFSTLRDVTGRLDAGGRDVLDLHVTWPENVPQVDNRYQGASLAMDLQVDAITTDLATPTTTPASTAPLGINGVAGADRHRRALRPGQDRHHRGGRHLDPLHRHQRQRHTAVVPVRLDRDRGGLGRERRVDHQHRQPAVGLGRPPDPPRPR